MAQNAKQRQKKLAKKTKKRKEQLAKRKSAPVLSKRKATRYTDAPVHECLIPDNIFELGMGTVLFSRKTSQNMIVTSGFVVDTFCLGVKNALFNVTDEYEYKTEVKPSIMRSQDGGNFVQVDAETGRKLIDGAVEYARELGFEPHSDYHNAYRLFGDIDPDESPMIFEYGKDGKPFYIRGPYENEEKIQRIIAQLTKKCGPDGFDFLMLGEDLI